MRRRRIGTGRERSGAPSLQFMRVSKLRRTHRKKTNTLGCCFARRSQPRSSAEWLPQRSAPTGSAQPVRMCVWFAETSSRTPSDRSQTNLRRSPRRTLRSILSGTVGTLRDLRARRSSSAIGQARVSAVVSACLFSRAWQRPSTGTARKTRMRRRTARAEVEQSSVDPGHGDPAEGCILLSSTRTRTLRVGQP